MLRIKCCLLAISLLGSNMEGVQMDFLPSWNLLNPQEKEALRKSVKNIDFKEVERQRSVILQDEVSLDQLETFQQYEKNGNQRYQNLGKKLIQEGKVGCLIVAGGQGSRLNYAKPKGFFPVTLVQKKSLFQLYAEKVLAAGKQVNAVLPVAIMTSSENHEEIIQNFKENQYFGLNPDQVFFFPQTDLAFLDESGNIFLESREKIAMGPDGNASSLKQFVESGIWEIWNQKGISYLNYMHIDNALGDPFDAELTGFHAENESSDLIIKCIEKENPEEKVGVLFKKEDKVVVVEYSEISSDAKMAKKEDGTLENRCANIGLYSFRMDFIHKVATSYYDLLPFHKAWKAVKYLDLNGESQKSKTPNAWKFEKFIFDVLPFALDVKALLYPRSECFAPLKNAEGEDSLTFVQAALQRRDRQMFETVSGNTASLTPFELDPSFYYPTPEILKEWKGKNLPDTSYINAF